jgi:hypothetical protein
MKRENVIYTAAQARNHAHPTIFKTLSEMEKTVQL